MSRDELPLCKKETEITLHTAWGKTRRASFSFGRSREKTVQQGKKKRRGKRQWNLKKNFAQGAGLGGVRIVKSLACHHFSFLFSFSFLSPFLDELMHFPIVARAYATRRVARRERERKKNLQAEGHLCST